MDETAFIPLGRVVKPHGLSGEISVRLEQNVCEVPVGVDVWFVPPADTVRHGIITAVRRGPKGPLVMIEGVDDVSTAEALRGATLVARPTDLPADIVRPEESLIGFDVVDEDRGPIGTIEEVIQTGANDVWIVRGGPFGEILVPVIDDVVLDIDLATNGCRVRLLPGLIEEGA